LLPVYAYRLAQSARSRDLQAAWDSMLRAKSAPDDYIAVFAVPVRSQGFTLRINNPWPQKDQPSLVSVKLDR
jgi:hypothetical protein